MLDVTNKISVFPDPTLTVDNVTKVINKIEGGMVVVMRRLGVPESLMGEIDKTYSTDSGKSHAYADYYVHIHPDGSWEHLTTTVYDVEEFTAARESKSFMSTGKCC